MITYRYKNNNGYHKNKPQVPTQIYLHSNYNTPKGLTMLT